MPPIANVEVAGFVPTALQDDAKLLKNQLCVSGLRVQRGHFDHLSSGDD